MNNDATDIIAMAITFTLLLGALVFLMGISAWKAHTHKWVESERWRTVGAKVSGDGWTGSGDLLQRMVFGVTTVRYECACGEHQFKEILGGQS